MKISFLSLLAMATSFAISVQAHADCSDESAHAQTPARDLAAELGLSAYDPIYFVVGANGGLNAKFQVSFKYRIICENGRFSGNSLVPTHLYLSFTQTSLWDAGELSSPFKDSSYRPRLFYSRDDWKWNSKFWQWGLEAGLAHESNGQADPDSRSINVGYVRPTVTYHFGATNRLYVSPMIIGYIDKAENPDINNYRGNVDLLIGFARGVAGDHDWNAWATVRKGDKAHYGSVEANLAIPFRILSDGHLNGWLLTQYFSGWGESLIDYNKKLTSQFRAGFAILVQ